MLTEVRCDVLVRSYWRDLAWLEFCLASIGRYCQGFGEVLVVVPRSSQPWLRRSSVARQANVLYCRDYADDYLGQQVTKLMADTFSDADLICHVDSDCVFTRAICPEDLLEGGKPRVAHCPYKLLGRHHPWRRPTEKFLGWEVDNDYMQHPPFVYPRWLYPEVRAHAVQVHGVDIETYVMAQAPRGFSEFNVLGALAWQHHREDFTWTNTSAARPPEEFCRWYWSWGGLDDAIRAELQSFLEPCEN